MTESLFGNDFPEYPSVTARDFHNHPGFAGVDTAMESDVFIRVLLSHLWLASRGCCACGLRPDRPRGQFYAWWAAHVAGFLTGSLSK